MLTEQDVLKLLADATSSTIIHVDYAAARPATAKGVEEYQAAADWAKPCQSYVGHFAGLKRNKWGELVLTIWCHNRGEAGAYRAFNPRLGTIRSLKVEPATGSVSS